MDLSIITKTSKQFQRYVTRNSPTILTAFSVAGLISTVILAVKATPKAIKILDQETKFRMDEIDDPDYGKLIKPHEAILLTWQCYVPTTAMGLATIFCIIGSNTINLRRNAALASLFSITETALKEYQAKIVEKIGANKEEKIRGEIDQDKLNNNPPNEKTIIVTNRGSMLCYDALSGRYFFSDVESIRKTQNDFNKRLMNEMVIPLNELYSDLGLDPIDMGGQMGWTIEKGMVDLRFGSRLTPEGQPSIVIEHKNLPTNIWG